ncbi:ninja-family protein mc410 isoform X1 [Rhododendron vialii]|uniref:ninja-family protein mc410 isoform X1 n=1 Tax=Rhododendron vialii TaxID=182163 RepID=UPI00266041B5|nr:ninja-family protein mc410 isoform X1 [Rhododendron vialii]XP_058213763.1 ninja-family protein mc410 isoform X1 [Rhododendron vialii]XP_058213764.1 ninja-family protein mc410 isoform X1 [Rhododendron vialii]XP_058213765.1 ninja-family protein mc410 isoform X1 [Rhododendron vialii]
MEDDNGLELSLGLSWGRSSAKAKDKSDNTSDTRIDEGDRSNKLINDFKNFLEGGTRKQESCMGSQRSDPVKPDDSFSNKFPSATADAEASENLNGRGLWVVNDNRGAEADEEKRPETSHKRKSFFDEISNQKKHDRESQNADFPDKSRPSHISINTDDGSTAENEDVADSEADGSTSRLVPQHDDGPKRYMRGMGPTEVSKEFHTVVESSMVDLQGQNKFTISSGKEFKVGNMSMPYGVTFPAQSVNILNAPYSLPIRESNSVGFPGVLPGMIQVMGVANSERAGTQHVMPGNLPMMFGYSPVQLPVLDKDNSQGLASHAQQLTPSYVGRPSPNSAAVPGIMHKPSEASQYNGTALEQTKGDRKQHANDGGSSYPTEDGVKGGSTVFGANGESDKPRTEGFISELPSIRPGIAADLKFGGCGSYPDLPWVSTKGPGPNGRTISGVTYRFSPSQIKIVCACHGTHMSREEFVRHAGEEDMNPDSGSGLPSLPNNNPAASAQS